MLVSNLLESKRLPLQGFTRGAPRGRLRFALLRGPSPSRSPTRAPAGVELRAVGSDVVLHGDGLDSPDPLNEVVNPGADAVAVVLCHCADVPHEMRRGAGGGQAGGEGRNVGGLVAHRDTQGVLDFRGDFIPIELFGAEQLISL